ncbi:MAG: uridine monophosphate kinase, partial [bacterium]|nr:uridine monophosphate kinase [bacterium]
EIKILLKSKVQTGVVLGAGNIFRGSVERQKERSAHTFTQTEADKAGMLGTLINSLLLSDILSQEKIKNKLLSTIFMDCVEFFNPRNAREYLEQGYVNIYAGGTSNPFVTTDTAAVLKAVETQCDVLIKATKVDGVYDKDPVKFTDAEFFPSITYMEVMNRKLKVMDLTAISMAMENHLPVIIMNFFKKDNLYHLLNGKRTGTLVHA